MTTRIPEDLYRTPEPVIAGLLPHLPRQLGAVLDPGAGDGVFQSVLGHLSGGTLRGNKLSSWTNLDIRPDAGALNLVCGDFLSDSILEQYRGEVDTVITNPPFSLGERFIMRALDLQPKRVIFLLRLAMLEGAGRYARLWSWDPPRQVLVLPRRPKFGGFKGSDKWAYAWFLWGDVPGSGIGWIDEQRAAEWWTSMTLPAAVS